jgi:hypothetical protein
MDNESEFVKKSLTKDNVYAKEQEEILNNIMTILDLEPNDARSTIDKDELELKFGEIDKLYDKIKLYHSSALYSKIDMTKNRSMSIIRTILRHHRYKFDFKVGSKTINSQKKTMQRYFKIPQTKQIKEYFEKNIFIESEQYIHLNKKTQRGWNGFILT